MAPRRVQVWRPVPSRLDGKMDADGARAMNDGEVAALLAGGPFASASALLIASGTPLRAVFATPAMLEIFGAKDLRALEAVAFRSESPGARRFRQLAQSLPAGAPARLERLRFFRAGHVLPLGLICVRAASAGGEAYLVAGSSRRSPAGRPRRRSRARGGATPATCRRARPRRSTARAIYLVARRQRTVRSDRYRAFPAARAERAEARRNLRRLARAAASRSLQRVRRRRSPRAARSRRCASNGRIRAARARWSC